MIFHREHQELKEAGDSDFKDTSCDSTNLVQEVFQGVQKDVQPQPAAQKQEEIDVIPNLANNGSEEKPMLQMMIQMIKMTN